MRPEMNAYRNGLTALIILTCFTTARGNEKQRDIEYARIGERSLKLDLYLPEAGRAPLLVWVHGGAWRSGSKESMPLTPFVDAGYAVASLDYRLTPEAPFPANVHDIKAAIRFLRAEQDTYAYDARNVVIAGASAGGHLAALVGTTNGHQVLEGSVGQHLDQSSDVQAIVSYFGAANLTTILQQSTPHGLKVRVPALELLLGGQPDALPDFARLASPVFHVDKNDPPLFLLHGDQDPQMPINQSHELHGAYEQPGLPVRFAVLHGSAHGGAAFFDQDHSKDVIAFLKEQVK
ncbi:MAG: acetyl esterase/lipase [Verrucomicrobiales bacterium]|jgi:acetyl esterase/lipase